MIVIWTLLAIFVPWAAGTALVLALGGRGNARRESRLAEAEAVDASLAAFPVRSHADMLLAIGAGWLAGQAMMLVAVFTSLAALAGAHAEIVLVILVMVGTIGGIVAARRSRAFLRSSSRSSFVARDIVSRNNSRT